MPDETWFLERPMKPFKDILAVLTDSAGDDLTLIGATKLAKRNDARLTVVEVMKDSDASAQRVPERQQNLDNLVASIRQSIKSVHTNVLVGIPFIEIVRQVLRGGHDVVIMAAEGSTGFRELFFGSTSMQLMRACPCPVWIVHPKQSSSYSKVLAAVDPDPNNSDADELTVRIAELAVSMVRLNNSEFHLAHAWDLEGKDQERIRSELPGEVREALLSSGEVLHQKAVERLIERFSLDDIRCHMHISRSDPAHLIPKIVEENDIDLIVMGTISRIGVQGFFIGNTAEIVLRQVKCSVLTQKPKGFVTPITFDD
jgi:nucleotide-binding universal stress UspA family protein